MKTSAPRVEARRGFALIITIVLVAFLVLILVGLATVTRVETQVANNSQQIAKARQNALMALNIAIGQLQKTTGPDQRVTATADLQPLAAGATTDPASGINLDVSASNTSTALASIDNYWKSSRNRRWTGAWKAADPDLAGFVANTPSASNVPPVLQSWLVSGNETIADKYKPTDVVPGSTFASVVASGAGTTVFTTHPGDPDNIAARTYRLLVGQKTTGIATAADLDRAVFAPQIKITSNQVPGLVVDSANPPVVGHYAWWVGDEGVKARVNLVDAYNGDNSDQAARVRLQSPQRPVLEAMTITGASSGTDDERGLAPFASTLANNTDLKKIIAYPQLYNLNTASTVYRDQLEKRWHDLSHVSRGVLSDTRHGGLRHDLTYVLSRPSPAALRAALPSGFAPNATYNRILSTTATPYAAQPPALTAASGPFSGNNVYSTMDMFAYSATWEQLWSYYNLGNDVSGTSISPRLHTGTQHGIGPVVVQVKLFYKLRMSGSTLDADGVDRTSEILMDIIPVLVLANPYNVDLAAKDYILRSTAGNSGRVRLHHGLNLANPEAADLKIPPVSTTNEFFMTNNGLGSVKLTVKAPLMEAGRAYVFTLENASTTIPALTTDQQNLVVNMVPRFNDTHVLTYNTTKKIAAYVAPIPEPPALPTPATQAALTTDGGVLAFNLYSADDLTTPNDQTLVRYLLPHTYGSDSANNTALVYPFSSNLRHGGGMGLFIHDASNVASNQQNTTYQVNYRSLIVDNAAYTAFTDGHPSTGQNGIAISFARTRVKNGSSSSAGNDTPNDHIQSHLLWRDPSNPTQVRWGIFNTGNGSDGTVVPPVLSGDAGLVNILYDVPRAENLPSAIAQLRHFNTAGHIPFNNWTGESHARRFALKNHSFQPNHPLGNSYPNPMIIREKVIDGDGGMGFQYDGSYLFNDALMDRFFFSTYPATDPATGPFDFGNPSHKLINNRLRPFRDSAVVAWNTPAHFRTDSRSAAKNLLVEGAFNINSTSVDAWKAILSSVRGISVGGESDPADLTAPFARTLFQPGDSDDSRKGNTESSWNGTINLDIDEIDDLAREIVLQVRRRGPFVSMADFTNRRLVTAAADTLGLGLGGALQAAVDRILNQTSDVHADLQPTSRVKAVNARIADDGAVMRTGVSGGPGYILQADILSSIEAALSARSDTFVVRTGDVTGRAWCEAVVQRIPDYVVARSAGGNDPEETPAAGSTNADFGRRYQVVSFRWLGPDDI